MVWRGVSGMGVSFSAGKALRDGAGRARYRGSPRPLSLTRQRMYVGLMRLGIEEGRTVHAPGLVRLAAGPGARRDARCEVNAELLTRVTRRWWSACAVLFAALLTALGLVAGDA